VVSNVKFFKESFEWKVFRELVIHFNYRKYKQFIVAMFIKLLYRRIECYTPFTPTLWLKLSRIFLLPRRFKTGQNIVMVDSDLINKALSSKTVILNLSLYFQCKLKIWSKRQCCKQWRQVKFRGTMTKWPVQNRTHRTTQSTIDQTGLFAHWII